jgi:carbon storage regulator CsrA
MVTGGARATIGRPVRRLGNPGVQHGSTDGRWRAWGEIMTDQSGWLVLGRKAGEEICIGDEIRVKVVSKDGSTIRIAVKAVGLKVLRGELFDKLHTEKGDRAE